MCAITQVHVESVCTWQYVAQTSRVLYSCLRCGALNLRALKRHFLFALEYPHLDNAHLRTSLSYLLRKGKAFLRSLSALVRAIHLATPGAESVAMSPLPISTSRDSDAGLSSAGVGLVERAKPKSPGNCRFDYRQKENMSRPASTSEGRTGKASACPAGRNRSMLARVCASLICYDTVGPAWPATATVCSWWCLRPRLRHRLLTLCPAPPVTWESRTGAVGGQELARCRGPVPGAVWARPRPRPDAAHRCTFVRDKHANKSQMCARSARSDRKGVLAGPSERGERGE